MTEREDDYDTGYDDATEASEEFAAATLAGITTYGVEETKRKLLGQEEDAPPLPLPAQQEQQQPKDPMERPPLFNSPVKVTRKMAEVGQKILEEKVEGKMAVDRAKLVTRIKRYYEYFPELARSGIKPQKFEKAKMALLEEELIRCQATLNNTNTMEAVRHCDIFFNYAMEKALVTMNVPVQGLTVEAKKSQEIVEQELKEFAIKYERFFSMGPEFRYMVKLVQRVSLVLERNRHGSFPEQMSQAAYEQMSNKYEDL